ncbi:MAG TPA: glutaredoxin domain-containing protein [Microbacteriaceae bacterium]|nr:glutaredoxin domain-containing protein [Microbacteriaceae bacterium]
MTQSFDKITMFGAEWCGDCRRSKALLDAANIDYDYIDLVQREDQAKVAESISGRKNIPVIVFPDGSFLVEPSNDELVAKL